MGELRWLLGQLTVNLLTAEHEHDDKDEDDCGPETLGRNTWARRMRRKR